MSSAFYIFKHKWFKKVWEALKYLNDNEDLIFVQIVSSPDLYYKESGFELIYKEHK